MTVDIGILATGLAVGACLVFGRGKWLKTALAIAWCIVLIEYMQGASKSVMVLTAAILDMLIAGAALIVFTHNPSRLDARTICGMSMSLMPAHFVMSASLGNVNWTLYVVACNLVFILQCLTAGGWLDGLGRRIAGIFRRMRPVRALRRGGH